jgi:hypothetical protein
LFELNYPFQFYFIVSFWNRYATSLLAALENCLTKMQMHVWWPLIYTFYLAPRILDPISSQDLRNQLNWLNIEIA